MKPKIVCLCGSSRWFALHNQVMMDETLAGNIVIPMGLYGHADFPPGARKLVNSGNVKEMLDELHYRKIDISDEIIVITRYNYCGQSTRNEIEYARKNNKHVRFINY